MKKKYTEEYFMKIALNQAKKALKNGDVPIGTIIVKKNKIIARAYNKIEKDNNSTKHAELIAISKASKKNKNWRLDECTLYTTMEPCIMCAGAILNSRIKSVVYGTKNNKNDSKKILNSIEITENICQKECEEILKVFFKKIR